MMLIAIDPGTHYLGFCIKTDDLLNIRTITEEKEVGVNRFHSIAKQTISNIAVLSPEYIAVEDYGFGGKFFNVEVAEMVGAIKYAVKEYGLKTKMLFIAPNTIKKIVTGNGRAKKKEVEKSVLEYLRTNNIELDFFKGKPSSHEFDSIAIMLVLQAFLAEELEPNLMRSLKGRIISYG